MKTTMKQQLQILNFADAVWEIECKHVAEKEWEPKPENDRFNFNSYDYRVVLPPLPEGYAIVPIGDVIKTYSDIITLDAFTHRNWSNGRKSPSYDFKTDVPGLIYAVRRQPTTKEVPLTMDDLPKGAGLWLECHGSIYQVTKIQLEGVVTHNSFRWNFSSIQEKRGRFSVDRSEWVNGWKEVEL